MIHIFVDYIKSNVLCSFKVGYKIKIAEQHILAIFDYTKATYFKKIKTFLAKITNVLQLDTTFKQNMKPVQNGKGFIVLTFHMTIHL